MKSTLTDEFPAHAWPPVDPAIRDVLLQAWQDGSWGRYDGPHGERLREALAAFHDVPYVYLCSSGTAAVELALRGIPVQAGEEVVLAGYDFPGNFRAVEAVGARPVLVDLEPQSWCLDAAGLEEALRSGRVRAVIVSHLHGTLADMQAIRELARYHGAAVIEDACQATGAWVQGRRAGSWGDVGVLSFGGSKLLTAGRGGALLIQHAGVYQRIKIYAERGNVAYPLSELQAAVLVPQLAQLDRRNEQRSSGAERVLHSLTSPTSPFIGFPSHRGSAAYYKLGLRLRLERSSAEKAGAFRSAWQERARERGLELGEGFRGFARRSEQRCRRVGNLALCHTAAETTLLVHHTVLSDPQALANLCDLFRSPDKT